MRAEQLRATVRAGVTVEILRFAADEDPARALKLLNDAAEVVAMLASLVAENRDRVALEWNESGASYAVIAEAVGLSRARVQQLVERGWWERRGR